MPVVIAIHEIEDVAGFWAAVRGSAALGRSAQLKALYPLVNGLKAVSVWDGISADLVGDFLDARLGAFSSSELYEVDGARVPNLPRESELTEEEDRRWNSERRA